MTSQLSDQKLYVLFTVPAVFSMLTSNQIFDALRQRRSKQDHPTGSVNHADGCFNASTSSVLRLPKRIRSEEEIALLLMHFRLEVRSGLMQGNRNLRNREFRT